ncbi:hypothetical protein RB11627 [Rhodopirellula baltica SH 1]|uniref:Uncharacterized protein n=1 Tax=Rhodopirellula baltica (strain DSM 10527 / NCIMB 13988 / SH1) TaxID=243090 RepID=Q7UE29_RHOBA|nr:hypothetical protein RB11627 [Rhodopirellula baltica SH 1]
MSRSSYQVGKFPTLNRASPKETNSFTHRLDDSTVGRAELLFPSLLIVGKFPTTLIKCSESGTAGMQK